MRPADEPALLVSNRGYRYGDGLFETMKIKNGKILLELYHFERLLAGLSLLKFELPSLFSPEKLSTEILQLCEKNECSNLARVRLSVSRGNGGLYDGGKTLQYVIECWPLGEHVNQLNENGLVIDIFPDAEKGTDAFSNLKSANFLPYSLAALYAKENKLNDCLLLNTRGNISDSTISNLFIIKGAMINTPALNEGCINGVMRRHLLSAKPGESYTLAETAVTVADIEGADEIFLTNAINGIRWVRQFRNKIYGCQKTVEIYDGVIKTIFS